MKKPTGNEIIEFVKEKWNTQRCPMCGNDKWSVSETIWGIQGFDGGLIWGGSVALPLVAVTCNNCGNTVLISALSTGLLRKE